MPGHRDKTEIGEFLLRVARDPGLAERLRTHPERTVQQEKLSDNAINLLKTQDQATIQAAVEQELGTGQASQTKILTDINLP
jgi:hypothetical protein